MEVSVTPDQAALIQQAIEAGRLRRSEDAVHEAMRLWEERERRRWEILAASDRADASLARGEGRDISTPQAAEQLITEVAERGRARLASDRQRRG